jgi:hypothetical protein
LVAQVRVLQLPKAHTDRIVPFQKNKQEKNKKKTKKKPQQKKEKERKKQTPKKPTARGRLRVSEGNGIWMC